MAILVLIAGTNDPSNVDALAEAFSEGIRATGATIDKLYMRDLSLPHFTLEAYRGQGQELPAFQSLKHATLGADGVVIASPIWNFSVPAHLKNTIDWMGCFGLDETTRSKGELKGKPFYFLYTGGAPVPAWKGLMRFTVIHVSEGIRYFGGTVTGRHFEGKCMLGRGTFGFVMDKRPEALERVKRKGEKFARLVDGFVKTKKLPIYYRLFTKAYKFGQKVMAKL